jgi:hypothetical protein
MSSSESKMDFFEVGDKTSLICADPNVSEVVRSTLRELDFKFHTAENADIAVERIRYTPYDIILIQENFSGGSLRSNPILSYLSNLPMAQRRHSMVVLVGSSFKTLDAMQAFAYSVQLVVNTLDLSNLAAILKKAWAEFESLYKAFKSVSSSMSEK